MLFAIRPTFYHLKSGHVWISDFHCIRFLNELLSRDLVQPNLGWYLIGQDKITEKSVWEQDKMVCYMEYCLIVKLSATGHLQFEYWTSPVICNYSSNFLWTSWSSKTGIINLIHKKLSWRVIQKSLIQILTWLILCHLILLKVLHVILTMYVTYSTSLK